MSAIPSENNCTESNGAHLCEVEKQLETRSSTSFGSVDGDGDGEVDRLCLPTKSSKPRVRRRRLCELNDSEIWRCAHCGKCYSKTSKAAILEHSRSSCQRKIAEDAEIKRQIEQYFRYRQAANPYHMGVGMPINRSLNVQSYPPQLINGRMHSAPHALYGNYAFPMANVANPVGTTVSMYGAGNAANAYTMLKAAPYQALYEENNAAASMYSHYANQLPLDMQMQLQQMNAGSHKYFTTPSNASTAALSTASLYEMTPPPLASLSSDSSSVSSLSPAQSGAVSIQSAVNDSLGSSVPAPQKMSSAQINQMNFITPAHASRSIHTVPCESALDAQPAAAAVCAASSSASVSAPANGLNASCCLTSQDECSEPASKRLRASMHTFAQHSVAQQLPVSYTEYEYGNQLQCPPAYPYQRQAYPTRFNGFRPYNNAAVSNTVAAAMLSPVPGNVHVHAANPSKNTPDGGVSASSSPDVCVTPPSASSVKQFSLLQPRSSAAPSFNRSTLNHNLVSNVVNSNQWAHY